MRKIPVDGESPVKLILPTTCFSGSILWVWELSEDQSCHRQRTLLGEEKSAEVFHNHMDWHVRLDKESEHMAIFPMRHWELWQYKRLHSWLVGPNKQNKTSGNLTEVRNQPQNTEVYNKHIGRFLLKIFATFYVCVGWKMKELLSQPLKSRTFRLEEIETC